MTWTCLAGKLGTPSRKGVDKTFLDTYMRKTREPQVLLHWRIIVKKPLPLVPCLTYTVTGAFALQPINAAVNGETIIAVNDNSSWLDSYYRHVGQGAVVQFDDIEVSNSKLES